MSAASTVATPVVAQRAIRTSFVGLLRGELRKIAHLRITWVTLGVITLAILGAQLLLITGPNNSADMRNHPLSSFANVLVGDVALVRILSGVFMLILAAHVVGLEYQHGTIRVLLARGVGRLHLLGAKVAALALVGLAVMALELLIELIFAWGVTLSLANGGQPWGALGAEFWADVRIFLFYLALNLVVTLLLSVAASVVGRSLAFGLAVGLSWFAVDNLLTIVLGVMARVTGSDFWLKLSGVLLGPLLNRLPDYITAPLHEVVQGVHGSVTQTVYTGGFGPQPLVTVPGGQALLIICLYGLLFAAVAIALTWRREILD
jgi:ABC-2 type transport system permease protein